MYARCMLLSFMLSTRRGILSPFLLAQTNLLLQASTLDFIWFLWTQIMMSAGCWNRWGGWCNNFRMDGLHASLWGDYRTVHAGLFFFLGSGIWPCDHRMTIFLLLLLWGTCLLLQSMLGSVITARDRWLKPGGLILPSHATVSSPSCLIVNIVLYYWGHLWLLLPPIFIQLTI